MSGEQPTAPLEQQAQRLLHSVIGWTPSRWSRHPKPLPGLPPTAATRADVMHHLVQRLADLAAAAERQPVRPVPRLSSDLALPNQLRVVLHDLLTADPAHDLLAAATDEVVLHRREIDGAKAPADVAALAARCPARA